MAAGAGRRVCCLQARTLTALLACLPLPAACAAHICSGPGAAHQPGGDAGAPLVPAQSAAGVPGQRARVSWLASRPGSRLVSACSACPPPLLPNAPCAISSAFGRPRPLQGDGALLECAPPRQSQEEILAIVAAARVAPPPQAAPPVQQQVGAGWEAGQGALLRNCPSRGADPPPPPQCPLAFPPSLSVLSSMERRPKRSGMRRSTWPGCWRRLGCWSERPARPAGGRLGRACPPARPRQAASLLPALCNAQATTAKCLQKQPGQKIR